MAPCRTRVGTRLPPDSESAQHFDLPKIDNQYSTLVLLFNFILGLVWTTMAPATNADGSGWPYLAPLYQPGQPVAPKIHTGLLYLGVLIVSSGKS